MLIMFNRILYIVISLFALTASAGAQNPYLQGSLNGGTGVPGTKTRSPLNSMERAAGSLAGATILTDTFGNQRLALFVHIEDTCINYTPAATGNTQNLSAFVEKCSTDSIWYIDWTGESVFLGTPAGGACDQDWLQIADNSCPENITDSIYHYKYAAIGARLVWPTAEFLISDSVATALQVISGSRNARLSFYDNQGVKYSTIDQSGATTIWYLEPTGSQFRITTAGGGTPQSPGAPFVNQFAVNPPDLPLPTIQAYLYPNTRMDTNTIRNFIYTDNVGKLRSQAIDTLIQTVSDSLAADTTLQVNWYTTNGTTDDLLRTATVKRSAWWRGIDSVGFLRWSNRPDNFNGSQFSLYQDSVVVDADTIIWESTFNTPLQFHDLRADVTYFYADSLKIANVGQFQSVVSLNYDGTDKGFFYDPANEGVFIINGNGISGIYNYLSVKNDRVKIDAFDPVSNNSNELEIRNTYTENDITIDIGGGDIFTATYYLDQTGSLLQGAFNGVPVSGFSANFGSPSFKLFAFDYFGAGYSNQTTINVQQVTNANYASMSLDTDADSAGISVGIGYAVPGVAQTFRSNDQVFAVQMLDNASSNFFSTLEIDLNQHFDTTENAVSFYNRAYYWKNEMPTGVAGDTLFHYWAEDGVNAGKNPGFITIDQICAHCAADAVNWYNSNGTTTDNTRIATVTETATWLSEDVTADGVFPFRFELTGNSPNEPEMMVWQFPAGDSATLSQSDQELILFSSNQWLFKSNEATTIQADSFQYNPNLGGTGFRVGQYNVITQNGITGTPTHRDAIEYNTITGTAQTEIFLDGSSAVWVLPTNSGTNFKIHVSAVCSAAGNGVGISTGDAWDSWHLGGIKRIGSTTSLVGTVQAAATAQSDAGMSTSVVTIDADDGDESLRIRFTPPSTAGTTTVIRVVASLELTQTSY